MSSSVASRVGLLGPWGGSDDAAVDIIFIHGLTGNREKTWTGKYGIFWPKDLLSKDIPDARIWSWGYDANIPDRPIIFVVHSLGGIVCENALVLATINAEQHIKQIATCTRGIIFLGTPLQGSGKTRWVDIGHRLAKLIGQEKNKDVVNVLKENSPRLKDLADSFANIIRDRAKTESHIDVVFFYEEFGTVVGHIVTKDSATVGGYEAQEIPADHVDMTKFVSVADAGYVRIRGVLKRWVEALEKTGKIPPNSGINVTQNIQKMMGGIVAGVTYGATTITSNYDTNKMDGNS
ncbi:hypothetical protein BPAE_0505g00010 [Botrytis paeoniae]|uniref:DUF676 domain-containing protein n=1 Tax=Botrytis paeoniae TaxID=278948 RepID=A0A4Z1EVW2_9HELO|nr:hypothetical protein BPAE_0505g00010 [Botrytis paeoniae]